MIAKTKQKIEVGIVGAGGISEFHIKGLRRIPFVDITGVADVNEARASELAHRFAVPRSFPSLTTLLEAGPDVVHVLTPPEYHAANAIEAIRGGCHVLVEKPLSTSLEDCDRIATAAREAGKVVCVGHSLLRDPFVARALEIARSGSIGEVIGVDHFRSQFYTPYAGGPLPYQYRDGGFPFRDLGVHSLYMLQAFLGCIQDATLQLGPPSRDGCPTYKDWRIFVRCERGMGQIYLSWNVQPLQDMLVVHGTRGVMRVDIMGMSVTVRKKGRLPGPVERILNSLGEGRRMMTQVAGNVGRVLRKKLLRYHGLQMLIGDFYESLRTGTPPPVTVDEARPIIDWTERIARQADLAKQKYVSQFATSGTATTLVTGATGFVGRHLLRRLLAERDRVRILVRHNPGENLLRDDRVEVVLGNLGNREDVDRAVRGSTEVFHLGATIEGWAEDFQCATTLGTRHVVESALAHGVQKLIYMSSLSVIHAASAASGSKITEAWPLERYPESRGLYSQTKLEAERIVSDAVREHNLRCIILRPGEVVGPDRPFLSGAVAIETGSRLVVLGNGRFTLPLIWVEDLVDAVMAAAKSSLFNGEVIHLVDPEQLSQDEIAKHYLAATGRNKRVVHAPLLLLYGAAFGANAVFRLLGRNAPLTPYRLRSAIGRRTFDSALAVKELEWRPRVGVARRAVSVDTLLKPGSRHMHVVIVDEELPYPPNSGKRIRILSLARHLAKRHRITFLCHRNTDADEARDAEQHLKECGIEVRMVDRQGPFVTGPFRRLRFGARLGLNLFSPMPFSVQWATCPRLRAAVRQYHSEHSVDIWQCEWAPYATALLGTTGIRWAMMAHDIQTFTWERYYRNESNLLKRWYIKKQWQRYHRYETRLFAEAPLTITVTEKDESRAKEYLSARHTAVVDNGVDIAFYQEPEQQHSERAAKDILFLGNLEWRPNLDAVRLLLEQIFPAVVAAEPSARLCIVGRRPPNWLKRRGGEAANVEVHGDVADVRPFLHRCGAMAVPLRIGGGSRLKILEALACGLPVVSSTVGAEGLCLEPGIHYARADQPAEMADTLIQSIRDPAPALAMAQAGRAIVEAQYDWSVLAQKMERAWEELLWQGTPARNVVSNA